MAKNTESEIERILVLQSVKIRLVVALEDIKLAPIALPLGGNQDFINVQSVLLYWITQIEQIVKQKTKELTND